MVLDRLGLCIDCKGKGCTNCHGVGGAPERVELGRRWRAAISTKAKAGNRYLPGHEYYPRRTK